MRKREQFAVSLRREKTKQIVSAKRRRLIALTSIAPDDTSGLTFSCPEMTPEQREKCLNLSSPEYNGYFKFVDRAFFQQLVLEVAPSFDFKGHPITQINVGIASLANQLSPLHQLALITAMRELLNRDEAFAAVNKILS